MDQRRPAPLSRRRLLLLGAGAAASVGAALSDAPGARAVPLSGVTATVSVASLDVRSGPASSRARIGGLSRGTTVSCTATASAWFRVSTASLSGWVHSSGVTLVASPAATITRGSTAAKAVALTFDCGDDRGYTGSILDTLAAKGVKCTFGMTGNFAAANGDLVRRIANEGHHLINHTLTHRSFTGVNGNNAPLFPAERLAELVATEDRIVGLVGVSTKPYFRPPYGDYDASVLRDIAAVGYRTNVMWTLDSLGWNGLSRDQVVARCLANHGNGYIYLLHVGASSTDGPALAGIIDGLRAKGYGFGTVPEVIAGTAPGAGGVTVSVAPTSGSVDTSVTVTGKGFSAGENVAIHWARVGSTPLATVNASASGVATAVVAVPKGPLGPVTVTAIGSSSGRRGTGEFAVTPSIRLNRTSGTVGTAVTATLRGFAAHQSVDIVWHHAASTVTVATVAASYSGSASVGFTVPAAHLGAHAVEGVGPGTGNRATASFAVSPSMALSTTGGAPGSTVRATLRGFARYETVNLTLITGGASEALGSVGVSSTGSAAVTVTIPAGVPHGDATITATGGGSGASVTQPFFVTDTVAPAGEATATPEPTATATVEPTATVAPTATVEPTVAPSPTPEPTAMPPVIGSVEVSEVEATRAVVRIVAAGADLVSVEFGPDVSYGTTVQAAIDADETFRAEIEALVGTTEYHYRVTATGPGGEVRTEDATFTTAADQDAAPAAEPTVVSASPHGAVAKHVTRR